ncbi:hypothetical protein [Bordetella genomosp. 13]|uniref:hypothetical protein n=1 Tax=Bordetella genomosp. 13 TaxID=463040 RepID=UPI00119FB18E|nr:hypothetical protein [Bordetella genomosp. 13]
MTTQSRIAAFLSTSALCLGLAAAPSAFAASSATNGTHAKTAKHKAHAHKSGAKKAAAPAPATMPAK